MPNQVSDRAAPALDALPRTGCTCMTKTPEIRYHREDCDYRRFVESHLASLKNVAEPTAE